MDPSEIRRLTEQANEALRRGDGVRALATADQLLAGVPDNPTAHAIRARALLDSDAVEEAYVEARRAVELDGHSEHAHRLFGLAAWRSQRLSIAQQSLERALELSGRRPELLAEFAWFMASERGPRLAEEAAQEAVDADRSSSTAWAALGLAQYKLHCRHEAGVSLRQALELDPGDPNAQSAMAVLLQDLRMDSQAETLAELLEKSPGTEEIVDSIRDTAKQRQIAAMLTQRGVVPKSSPDESRRRRAVCIVTTAILIAGICLFFERAFPVAAMICVILPLLLLWYLRQIAG